MALKKIKGGCGHCKYIYNYNWHGHVCLAWNEAKDNHNASSITSSAREEESLWGVKKWWLGDNDTKMQSLHLSHEPLLFPHQHKTIWRRDPWCLALYHLHFLDWSPRGWRVLILYACAQKWMPVFSSSMKTCLQMSSFQSAQGTRHSQSSLPVHFKSVISLR